VARKLLASAQLLPNAFIIVVVVVVIIIIIVVSV
jgi:hypothetical protein